MTVNLYIPSTQNFSGKSAICFYADEQVYWAVVTVGCDAGKNHGNIFVVVPCPVSM